MKKGLYKDIQISKDFIWEIKRNIDYNENIIEKYYELLHKETGEEIFSNKKELIKECNNYWLLDDYKNLGIKDYKKTNLCKDKFCNNCKKVKQANRMYKFIPEIKKVQEDLNLYHMVLTIPNVNGNMLLESIKRIFKNFRYLIRYLNGHKKIKGLEFDLYGFRGAIRSLEVTFKNDSYHPHLHCIMAFEGDVKAGENINKFSYSYGEYKRSFSDFEILLQKIWFLLNTDHFVVNKKNIEKIDTGFSIILDEVNDNSFYEVFKYMTKSTDEEKNGLTYENFKTLYYSTYNIRQIQGYGIFYNIKEKDIENEIEHLYDNIINALKEKDTPVEVLDTPQQLIDSNSIIISRKKIYSYLKNL